MLFAVYFTHGLPNEEKQRYLGERNISSSSMFAQHVTNLPENSVNNCNPYLISYLATCPATCPAIDVSAIDLSIFCCDNPGGILFGEIGSSQMLSKQYSSFIVVVG